MSDSLESAAASKGMGFKKQLTYAGIFLVFAAIGLVIFGMILPRDYHVTVTQKISASPEIVAAKIQNLKAWQEWCNWTERNPNYAGIVNSYEGEESGVGAVWTWTHSSGNGRQEIKKVDGPFLTEVETVFAEYPPMENSFVLEPEEDGIKVIWSISGRVNSGPVDGWFTLFLPSMMKPDLQIGLDKLKEVCEIEAKKPQPAPAPSTPPPNAPTANASA